MALLGLFFSACSAVVTNPAPPEHPGPSFVVNSAPSLLGKVSFEISEARHVAGKVELTSALTTTHPLRLAVRWSPEWQGTLRAVATLPPVLDGRAGEQRFDSALLTPPDDAVRILPFPMCTTGAAKQAVGDIVLFVDVNENGELDVFDSGAVDQVLGSSAFPTELFGLQSPRPQGIAYSKDCVAGRFSAEGATFSVFDDRRLDLVACAAADVFSAQAPCGVVRVQRPIVAFDASASDGTALLGFFADDGLEVFVDGESRGAITGKNLLVNSTALLSGEHRVRVTGAGLAPWEATVRLPQLIVVLERPAVVKAGVANTISWSTQGGAPHFSLRYEVGELSSLNYESVEAPGTTLTWRQAATIPLQDKAHFELSARFGDYPGSARTSFDAAIAR